MDGFNAAFRLPNCLQNVCADGALSASFIPVYARLLGGDEKQQEEADRVAWAVFTLLALVVSVLVVVGVLTTPLLINVIAMGFEGEKRDLTERLVRIFFRTARLLVASGGELSALNRQPPFL